MRRRLDVPTRLGLMVLGVLLLGVLLGPAILPDPDAQDWTLLNGPLSLAHPLGSDELGRDILARLLQGGRISLAVACLTAVLAAALGTGIGLVAGYKGGWVDALLMRLTDATLALPLLPLLIVLSRVDFQKLGFDAETIHGETFIILRMILILTLFGWTTVARLVRASTLSVKTRDYIRASVALGVDARRIMIRHVLPNVASPIIVAMTLLVGHIILVETALSFLGVGIQLPLASWGNMLTAALTAPEQALWPGLAIFLAVLGFNLVGDGLQRALDPRGRNS